MPTALITGIEGQDGAYLAKLLLEKGYRVVGGYKRSSRAESGRLEALGISGQVELVALDLLEFSNVLSVIECIRPDEVYNLAAQSFVGVSFQQPIATTEVNGLGTVRLLEALRVAAPNARFYQASTSEMFGNPTEEPQNEDTPFRPCSPYAAAKLYAHWMTVMYREAYNMFACCGICFNHESPLRGMEFVTRKISWVVAQIYYGLAGELVVGNLDAARDWGFAPEYVEAMWRMLQQTQPRDYVIATGETHTVREFVTTAFAVVGIELEWRGSGIGEVGVDNESGRVLVRVDPSLFRPAEVYRLRGDARRAREELRWVPRVTFRDLVRIMVEEDLRRVARWQARNEQTPLVAKLGV